MEHSVNTQTFFLGSFQIFERCNRWYSCLQISHPPSSRLAGLRRTGSAHLRYNSTSGG
jgi:hypothetical protein